MLGVLKRVTGSDLIKDLSEFFGAFGDMAIGIRERAGIVKELLSDPGTTFLLVTSPRHDAIDEAIFFRRRLRRSGMPFGAAVVNRVHEGVHETANGDDVLDDLVALLGERLGRRVARNFDDYRRIGERDRANVERLAAELRGDPLVQVPLLDDDVHDLAGLTELAEHLFAEEAVAA